MLERAAIELGDAPTTVGDVLSTTIDVSRLSGTEPITITETGSTLLFQVLPQGPAGELATMGPASASVALPVEVRATRCDAHVVSQSQLSYRFPVWVQVGEAEPQYVFLEPGPGLRAGLEALVQQCIAREGSGPPGTLIRLVRWPSSRRSRMAWPRPMGGGRTATMRSAPASSAARSSAYRSRA